ncbi:MAG: pilus assembly PilX N-terminal domain-containing protein [Candidatus Accumulibacter phosphatis]|uniref:pilus assembly PilX family protein n=1 Tax=Candidatus Accumulibacter phosphatis TaxID=327160 RepID=UPI001A5C3747|nr:pilus assembly PilX N-terminal domain-containing protein [Candidatus Accumulibacter phosphatis]
MKTTAQSQAGVVLVTSLIMLVMMTLLVVSLVRTSVIELKIGGASQIAAQNLANAEASIWAFMNAPGNHDRFHHGAVMDVDLSDDYDFHLPQFKHLANVTLAVNEVSCGADAAVGRGNMVGVKAPQAVYFHLRVDSRDTVFAGRTIVHQGIRGILPPGSCP